MVSIIGVGAAGGVDNNIGRREKQMLQVPSKLTLRPLWTLGLYTLVGKGSSNPEAAAPVITS
jgi:hypothetical protein